MGTRRYDMMKISEREKISLLKKIIGILERHNIHYWLESGTLLGYMRNKKFIPWDLDIDIGSSEDIEDIKKLEDEFNREGMEFVFLTKKTEVYSPHINIFDKSIPKKSGFHGDILFFKDEGEETICNFLTRENMIIRMADTINHALNGNNIKQGKISIGTMNKLILFFTILPENIKKMLSGILLKLDVTFATKRRFIFKKVKTAYTQFYGIDVKIPEDAEDHLLLAYGKKWRIPDKKARTSGEEFEIEKEGVKICKIKK